jgi:hypothetical protein
MLRSSSVTAQMAAYHEELSSMVLATNKFETYGHIG